MTSQTPSTLPSSPSHTSAGDQPPTVALIHAVLPAIAPMREAVAAQLPRARVLNLLDEGLLFEVERHGGVTSECIERLATQIGLAMNAGAHGVLLTCTAYSNVVPEMQSRFAPLPVLAVDQVMVETAVERAAHIGVLATVPAGLEQQTQMLERAAQQRGKQITIIGSLHPEAMAALQRGDGDTHDRILREAFPALAAQVELVLLAQASMARAARGLPDLGVPVLTSPRLAVERLAERLEGAAVH